MILCKSVGIIFPLSKKLLGNY